MLKILKFAQLVVYILTYYDFRRVIFHILVSFDSIQFKLSYSKSQEYFFNLNICPIKNKLSVEFYKFSEGELETSIIQGIDQCIYLYHYWMNHRIIVTDKATEIFRPDPFQSQIKLDNQSCSLRSDRLLNQINKKMETLATQKISERKQCKQALANKIKRDLVMVTEPTSQYLVERIDTMAEKLERNMGDAVPEHVISGISAYVDRLQLMHTKTLRKYSSLQHQISKKMKSPQKPFIPQKLEPTGVQDTHFRTRFQQRLKKQHQNKYGSYSGTKLPKVYKKYQIAKIQNQIRIKQIKAINQVRKDEVLKQRLKAIYL